MDEWQLLVTAEDIEEGDAVRVDRPGRNKGEDMVFVRDDGRYGVILKDKKGKTHEFTRLSLEQVGGNGWISGKAKETFRV